MDERTLILAILEEARSQGMASLLRTFLVKYLYLIDVYTAEETQGTKISNIEWRFLHFGPYSHQIAHTLETLSAEHQIDAYLGESKDGDKEYCLYSLPKKTRVPNLREIGISGSIQTRLYADMKRYGKDLSRLLDFVYFHTAPMEDVKPGDILDFTTCSKIAIDDVKPLEMKKLRPKAIKQTRDKIRELILARKKGQHDVQQGPFDETYYSALSILDGDPLEAGSTGRAKLKV